MASIRIDFTPADEQIRTQVGLKHDRTILVSAQTGGVALFGPYVSLVAGGYAAKIFFSERGVLAGDVEMDVCAEFGVRIIKAQTATSRNS
jgi:hypothetical protein